MYEGSRTEERPYTYDAIQRIAEYLQEEAEVTPKIGIICGTGLSALVNGLENPKEIPFFDIPNFPKSPKEMEGGSFTFGTHHEIPVVYMKGRYHFYEGQPLWKIAVPVRVFKLLGCTHIIITNSAASINKSFRVGDIMMINDHINFFGLSGINPLRGRNENRFGERFPNLSNAYDKDLRKQSVRIAKNLSLLRKLKQGTYAVVAGPNDRTVAETRMLEKVGVDCVGMSTVPEVITARHCGLTVFALSLVVAKGVLTYEAPKPSKSNKDEVLEDSIEKMRQLIILMIKFIGNQKLCACNP